jgi:hypothetical protein
MSQLPPPLQIIDYVCGAMKPRGRIVVAEQICWRSSPTLS